MGDWTGTVPTYAAGDEVTATNMQTETAIETALTAAWTSWTPTLTNITAGNGTTTAKYRRVGKTVDYRFKFTLGSTSAIGSNPQFTLPAAPHADYVATFDILGWVLVRDVSVPKSSSGAINFSSGSTVNIFTFDTTGVLQVPSSTVPFTWATGDTITVSGVYETS